MIRNPFAEVEKELGKVETYLEVLLPDVDERIEDIRRLIDDSAVSVMFFGAYNAGKSTLINAILRREAAGVGDVPTTDSVDIYAWDDFKLLDTPGINAPIEHEKISRQALERADLLVFVIRKDDEDSAIIYKEMFSLLRNRRAVFVVFNYNGLDPNKQGEGGVSLSVDRLRDILIKYAGENGVPTEVLHDLEIVPINLLSALKGRLSNNDKLVEYSNFKDFLDRFGDWLHKYEQAQVRLDTVKRVVTESLLTPAIESLDLDKSELDELLDQQRDIEAEKRQLLSDMERYVEVEGAKLVNAVTECVISGEDEESLRLEIDRLTDNFYRELEEEFRQRVSDVWERLPRRYVDVEEPPGGEDSDKGLGKFLKEAVDSIPNLPPALKMIIKGVISILFGGDDDRRIEEEKRRAMARAQMVRDINRKIVRQALNHLESLIDKKFAAAIADVERLIEESKQGLDERRGMKTALIEAKHNIEKLEF